MILTNVYNLPQQVYDLVAKDVLGHPYDDEIVDFKEKIEQGKFHQIRVSELINPPLVRTLKNRYKGSDDMVVDASFYLVMIWGTLMHALLEGPDTETRKHERKVVREYELDDGTVVQLCGTIDQTDTDEIIEISDNKTCVAKNSGYDDKDSYVHQLQTYSEVGGFLDDGRRVQLKLRYFIKDFSPKSAGKPLFPRSQKLYPPCPYYESLVPTAPQEQVRQYIKSRINDHLQNPERVCTPSERNFDCKVEYAVMVKGRDRAVKLCSTEMEAQDLIEQMPADKRSLAFVEIRGDMRCKWYCEVVTVCPYAQSKGYKPIWLK